MKLQQKLKELGLELPQAPAPVAVYKPAVRAGSFIYTSGQLPLHQGNLIYQGRLGEEVTLQDGKEAARVCALNCLAAAAALIDLDQIKQVVRVTGYVASAPDFHNQPQVVNGASELLQQLLAEKGEHSRAAVGVSELPLNAPVEVDMIFLLDE